MPVFSFVSRLGPAFGIVLALGPGLALAAPPRSPADLVGTWNLTLERDGTETAKATCRIMLRPQQSVQGDYFMGLPTACRHAMPVVAKALRWKTDGTQLVFDDALGAPVVSFAASGDGFKAAQAEGSYLLTFYAKSDSPLTFNVVDEPTTRGFATVQPISKRDKAPVAERDRPSDLAGRYAVMRDKRDTGCMITLDGSSHVKGGERAQLAPGCRDQGIVIFDPSAWMLVKGELVLTARAGHKTVLEKQGEGSWAKDAKDGGKPLGLKKL